MAFIKKIILLVSVGSIFGAIIGLIEAFSFIFANRYFHYKMFRLIAQNLQHDLNKWVLLCVLGALAVGPLLFLLARFIWKKLPDITWKPFTAGASVAFILLAILNMALFADSKINIPKGPNVILIVIDALRPDHLGCYGYQRDTSPNIDKLAKEGIIFKNAYANAPWTKPSVATIFTSLYPNLHGAINANSVLY